jgi:hypothetical protein
MVRVPTCLQLPPGWRFLYLTEGPTAPLPDTYLYLEDDVLEPLWGLAAKTRPAAAWTLFGDLYGDADFDPPAAAQLAADCQALAVSAEPIIAVWLRTLAALSAAASAHGKYLRAIAD